MITVDIVQTVADVDCVTGLYLEFSGAANGDATETYQV